MKIARAIITFGLDLACLILVLIYPGQATMASLLVLIILNGINLITEKFISQNKKYNISNCSILIFTILLFALLIILLSCSHIIYNADTNNYFIAWDERAFGVGGKELPYYIFVLPAFAIGFCLQVANLIKSLVVAAQQIIKPFHEAAECE